MKGLEPTTTTTTTTLDKVKNALEALRKTQDDTFSAQKVAEDNARNAEKREKESEDAVLALRKWVTELKASSTKVKKERDEATRLVQAITQNFVDFTRGSFQNFLDQVLCMYPKLEFDLEVFKVDH